MNEPSMMLIDLSLEQWIAFVGFAIATIGFAVWIAALVRSKK
ncbi:MAG: hypothetical protein ACREDZ_15960 [Kiloniellales bacterium]